MLSLFADFSPIEDDGWAVIDRLKPTSIVLGLNDSTDVSGKLRWKGLFPQSGEDRVVQVLHQAHARGIEVEALVWMRPDKAYIDAVLEMLVGLISHGAAFSSVILDLESAWLLHGNQAQPYESITDYMMSRMRLLGLPIGVTGYGVLRPAVSRAASLADFTIPQAYSVWGKSASSRRQESSPGVLQPLSAHSWSQHSREMRLSLPLFGLSRPSTVYSKKMNDDQSFTTQAHALPAGNHTYLWSLKHLTKLPPNRQARFCDLITRLLCPSETTSPTSTKPLASS